MNTTKKRIDLNLFKKEVPATMSGGVISESLYSLASESRVMKELIDLLVDGDVWWVSECEWSMHQLLMGLLELTGPADVMISSYAMGETPARILAQLKESGVIKRLDCVLDDRVDVRNAKSLQLIMNICDSYALIKTHAKVTLISNEQYKITVVCSANYTENERFESGVISKQFGPWELNRRWIAKMLNHAV